METCDLQSVYASRVEWTGESAHTATRLVAETAAVSSNT